LLGHVSPSAFPDPTDDASAVGSLPDRTLPRRGIFSIGPIQLSTG
jgi:hypothetical protein